MWPAIVCFIWYLQSAFVTSMPTSSEHKVPAGLSQDMAVIRLCNMTSAISLESMNAVLINRQLNGVENAEGFKCFLHCLYNKYNWMDEEGGFMLGNMKNALEVTQMGELTIEWLIFKCSTIDSPDKCERAYKFTECFWSETSTFPDEEDGSPYRMD